MSIIFMYLNLENTKRLHLLLYNTTMCTIDYLLGGNVIQKYKT